MNGLEKERMVTVESLSLKRAIASPSVVKTEQVEIRTL
jgi:hypothetical protein